MILRIVDMILKIMFSINPDALRRVTNKICFIYVTSPNAAEVCLMDIVAT